MQCGGPTRLYSKTTTDLLEYLGLDSYGPGRYGVPLVNRTGGIFALQLHYSEAGDRCVGRCSLHTYGLTARHPGGSSASRRGHARFRVIEAPKWPPPSRLNLLGHPRAKVEGYQELSDLVASPLCL